MDEPEIIALGMLIGRRGFFGVGFPFLQRLKNLSFGSQFDHAQSLLRDVQFSFLTRSISAIPRPLLCEPTASVLRVVKVPVVIVGVSLTENGIRG